MSISPTRRRKFDFMMTELSHDYGPVRNMCSAQAQAEGIAASAWPVSGIGRSGMYGDPLVGFLRTGSLALYNESQW
jgi:hypothetical protein